MERCLRSVERRNRRGVDEGVQSNELREEPGELKEGTGSSMKNTEGRV